jgi:hypothetical protein
MLGHRNLASTERYIHLNIDHLARVHTARRPNPPEMQAKQRPSSAGHERRRREVLPED